jgi:trimeric autotransporter adhesin
MTRQLIAIMIGFAVVSAWHSEIRAQSFQGGLRGAVRDASGGVLPGVSLSLTNEGTHVARSTVSNEVGEYAFPAVTPGAYTLTATLQGFKTFERRSVTIGTQTFITLDFTMETGTIAEEIVVTGSPPLVETANASTGGDLDKATLESLPSQNRNGFLMAVALPTVVSSGDASYNRMQDQSGGSSLSLGGGAVRANNYLLDGVSFAALDNRPAMFPSMEALGDIKVQVHTYDAEMGRTGGGVFNATLRSGSNQWRGSGFVLNRPTWGIANGYFAKLAGLPKPSGQYYWDGGGAAGGPLVTSRTFVWASTEDYRYNTTSTGSLIFPTDLERQGNFSQTFDRNGNLVVIYDPLNAIPNPSGSGTIRVPFPGNIIPANRLSQTALAIAKLLPKPDGNTSGANGVANTRRTASLLSKAYQGTLKVDHKLSDSATVSGSYVYQNTAEPAAMYWDTNTFADPNQFVLSRIVKQVGLNGTIVANDSTVVTARFGYYRYPEVSTAPSTGMDLATLGFPASFVKSVSAPKMPSGLISGIGEIGGGMFNRTFGDPASSSNTWHAMSVNGTASKLIGRHTVKVGGDFSKIGLDSITPGQTSGTYFFDSQYTQGPNPLVASSNAGNAFASFLLGYPSQNTTTVSTLPIATPLNVFLNYYAGYAQDDFRASSKLTLNFGLRYEYETGLQETANHFTVAFDQTALNPLAALTGLDLHGGLAYAGQNGAPTYQGDPSKTKFAPRAGIVWLLSNATVIRSGYGVFYAPWNYQSPNGVNYGQIGYTATTSYDPGTSTVPRTMGNGIGGLDNPFPNGLLQPIGNALGLLTGAGSNIDFVSQDRRSPRVQQWSIDLQRELPGHQTVVSVQYMGARGDHLGLGGSSDALVNINQLDPKYLALGSALNAQVPNPFFGVAQAGAFSASPTIAAGQLLRPFPEFGNVIEHQLSAGRSMYHAIVFEANRRAGTGWGGRVSYTYSRLKDNQYAQSNFWSRNNAGALPENNYDLDAEYSTSLLDMPHRFVISPFVELPFGEGKRWLSSGVGRQLLGNWTAAAFGSLESGFPLNVTQLNNNSGSLGGGQRPNVVAGVDPNTDGSITNYVNAAAFAPAAPFTFGNAPRTDADIRTPFRINWDASLTKSIKFGATTAIVRADLLNVFDNVRYLGPVTALGNTSFGTITAQGGLPRSLQLTIRFSW